eukprot:758708-Hanusia_phi.AAC.1
MRATPAKSPSAHLLGALSNTGGQEGPRTHAGGVDELVDFVEPVRGVRRRGGRQLWCLAAAIGGGLRAGGQQGQGFTGDRKWSDASEHVPYLMEDSHVKQRFVVPSSDVIICLPRPQKKRTQPISCARHPAASSSRP